MTGGAARLAPLCLLLALLPACQARIDDGSGEPAAVVEEEAPARASACESVVFEDTPLTDCTADPALHTIRTVLAGPDGTPYRSFAALASARGVDEQPVAFAMNAGMFDEAGQPIGYYVEQGERLHRLNRAEGPGNFHMLPNGVFFGDADGNWRVWDSDRFYHDMDRRPGFGTQSGPMLVIDGELHPGIDPDGDSLKVRNGVGVDRAGRAHFVISEAPVSFGRFARYFRDVIRTPQALFLDGSVSQLWDPARGRMDNKVPIGPMILVEIRDQGE